METSQITLSFANVSGKKIEADFDGGTTTSDGGVLLLRQAEARTGIVNRLVGAMSDRRHQSYIDHTYTDLIRQRVFQIACGYEDANDSDDLRSDPGLKIACERLPLTGDDLASQPTMSRLENSVTRSDLYRMGEALLETFIESYDKPPKKLILDIDDTDDPTHGSQQLTLFHAYYDEYCYLPIHLYEGETGKLITTLLRPGRRIRGREAAAILKRVLDHLIMVWPKTKITLRGDSHFSTPEVHDLCDGYGIDFILGQAINKKLKALGEPLMELAAALAEQTDEPVRLFDRFDYRAGSWSRPRIIIYKAEITQGKTNPRFVVTNIRNRTPRFLYEKVYCARGRIGRLHQESQDLPALRPDVLPSLSSQSVPSLPAQRRLRACARDQTYRYARHPMDDVQLRYDPTPRPQNRRQSAGASHQDSLSLSDVVSPQGLDEDDRPQPRHGVNAHTDGDVQKIDHQHDQGITSLKRKAIRPDTATSDHETRTRQSQLSEKRLRVPSSNGSRSNSANS